MKRSVMYIKDQVEVLLKSYLFMGMEKESVFHLLDCLKGKIKEYRKGEFLIQTDDVVTTIGIVLEGYGQIVYEDYWGNKIIFSELQPSDVFGEVFAILTKKSEVSVAASSDMSVIWLDIKGLITVCSQACGYHNTLVKNLLISIAEKNLKLTLKMNHIGKKTTRDKLLSYLSGESFRAGSSKFVIPFNRQDLADYLFVDRSALSNEIGKLKKEKILNCHKNEFELLVNDVG